LGSVLLGSYLSVLSVVFALFFSYLFQRDKDKRKLMFMLVFVYSFFIHIPEMIPGFENTQIQSKIAEWGPLPVISAILIAILSNLLRQKDFRKSFKIFLFLLATSAVMMLLPLPVSLQPVLLYPVISMVTIVVSVYLMLRRREVTDLMFLLAMLCFTLAEVGRSITGSGIEFVVFSYTCAHMFLALVFVTARESEGSGIASFFALEREFEKTQKELEISQDQLMRAEDKFKSLVNFIADPVVIVDHKGHILEINDKVEELTGFSKEDLLGKNFLKIDLLPMKSKAIAIKSLAKRMMGIDVKPYEIEANKKSGETVYLEINAKKIEYEDKSADLVVFHDITERKMIEEKLEKYAEQLEEEVKERTKTLKENEEKLRRYSEHLEELVEERTRALKESQELLVKSERLAAIGQAATMVGHDLRNPLQAIENATYYLNTELSNLPISQKTTETLQTMHRSIEYADKIVKDLQTFASKREPLLREIDINALVKETFSHLKTPENVETVIELGELPKIEADKDMIKRVFVNLAVNGIQSMKEKGGILKISTKKSNGFIEVKFKDTGIGIKKENIPKIFTPFFTTKAQGMGVGLSVCKRFAEIHDGSIKVESEEGKGSIFTVKLPIQMNGGVKRD